MVTRFRLLALAALLTAVSAPPAGAVWLGLSREALGPRTDAGLTVLQAFPERPQAACTDGLWI
ncbi:hypothetical protein [Salinarimonas soli]|uniref:Uncharacterized protein n=1 Tax=Salinarimonas soli TaxID=1638099 RepID=A0A5B2VEP0_9HYPH|nr:hypothetical protein [Salinarimonas soli]KAA2236910.1 hypothetical protein F0L46_13045 [Salinarimonas soli]